MSNINIIITTHQRSLGDAMHAVLCGAGHNLKMILAH